MKIPSLGKGIETCPDCGRFPDLETILSEARWKFRISCKCGSGSDELYVTEKGAISTWNSMPKAVIKRRHVLDIVEDGLSYVEYYNLLVGDWNRIMPSFCGKCGGVPEFQTEFSRRGKKHYSIRCRSCTVQLDYWYFDRESAVAIWNRDCGSGRSE